MDNSSNDAIQFTHDDAYYGASTNWYALLFAVIVTLFAVYWGFVRPTSRQLTKLRRYVTSLETSIADLNGHRANQAETLSLLEQLSKQSEATTDALASLDEIRSLHRRIILEADQLGTAREALRNLAGLRADIARHSSLIESTTLALESIQEVSHQIQASANASENAQLAVDKLSLLRDGLIESIDLLDEANPILAGIEQLHSRLAVAAEDTALAREVTENLLAIEEDLVYQASETEAAQLALDDLFELRDQVAAQSTAVEKADLTLDRMIQLQDHVSDQTEAVATALETMELAADLQQEMSRAGETFHGVRRMLTDMVLLQPHLQQATECLQPLSELSNLRRLGIHDLRQIAHRIKARHSMTADTEPAQVVAGVDTTVK